MQMVRSSQEVCLCNTKGVVIALLRTACIDPPAHCTSCSNEQVDHCIFLCTAIQAQPAHCISSALCRLVNIFTAWYNMQHGLTHLLMEARCQSSAHFLLLISIGVSLFKLDSIHKGPGYVAPRHSRMSQRVVLFCTIRPTCPCHDHLGIKCRWQGLDRDPWKQIDQTVQLHPPRLCSKGAAHLAQDQYNVRLFQLMRLHQQQRLERWVEPQLLQEYKAWNKQNRGIGSCTASGDST